MGVEFRGPGHFKNFSEHPTRLTYEALQRASVVTDTKNPQLVKLTSGTGPILIFWGSEGQIWQKRRMASGCEAWSCWPDFFKGTNMWILRLQNSKYDGFLKLRFWVTNVGPKLLRISQPQALVTWSKPRRSWVNKCWISWSRSKGTSVPGRLSDIWGMVISWDNDYL